MIDFGEFAKLMEKAAAEVRPALEVDLAKIGEHVRVVAAEFIGHELPEWPALAPSTIAEKTRLGYVNQVSATDPLLRTGGNRESIGVEVEGLEVAVGSPRKEFLYQEMGTARTPPRPALAPAMIGAEPYAAELLGETAVKLLTPRIR